MKVMSQLLVTTAILRAEVFHRLRHYIVMARHWLHSPIIIIWHNNNCHVTNSYNGDGNYVYPIMIVILPSAWLLC